MVAQRSEFHFRQVEHVDVVFNTQTQEEKNSYLQSTM